MANYVKKASLRTAGLDYAKRAVKAPTLATGLGVPTPAAPKQSDYAKLSPYNVGATDGPLALSMLGGKPKKLKL